MKIGVVGAGFVGAAAGYAMVLRGSCSDLVLVDANAVKAEAEAADIGDAAPVSYPVRVTAGGYDALADASLVVITAGANQKPGEDRLSLLTRNAAIFREVIPQVLRNAPGAVIVVATNPVDILTDLTARLAGPEMAGRVFGSGTVLDTARLRAEIATRANVDPQHVHAYVLGEHGDSEMIAWTHADIAGLPISEFFAVRGLNWTPEIQFEVAAKVRVAAGAIIRGKGATYFGVGAGLARIAEAVLRDARAVLTVSAPSKDFGVSLSLPRLVGGGGLLGEIKPVLSEEEAAALAASAAILTAAGAQL